MRSIEHPTERKKKSRRAAATLHVDLAANSPKKLPWRVDLRFHFLPLPASQARSVSAALFFSANLFTKQARTLMISPLHVVYWCGCCKAVLMTHSRRSLPVYTPCTPSDPLCAAVPGILFVEVRVGCPRMVRVHATASAVRFGGLKDGRRGGQVLGHFHSQFPR